MEYNNYIVAVNENGEPYIAHAYAAGGADGAGQKKTISTLHVSETD